MGEYRHARLGVPVSPSGQVTPDRHPQDHRARPFAGRPPPHSGRLALYLLHGRPDVIEELDLGHGPQSPHALAHSPANDIGFGQGRVVTAVGAELSLQAESGTENASFTLELVQELGRGVSHILAEDSDPGILGHGLM